MDYFLRQRPTFDDIGFLNETTYKYELFNPHLLSENDSGWCDMGTGGRIVTASDRIIFRDITPEQFTLLRLKYEDRLKTFTGNVQDIYDEAAQHNVGPLTVFDSETVI